MSPVDRLGLPVGLNGWQYSGLLAHTALYGYWAGRAAGARNNKSRQIARQCGRYAREHYKIMIEELAITKDLLGEKTYETA